MFGDITGNQPEWAMEVVAKLKATDEYKRFVEKTQKGELTNFYDTLGFFRDSSGIYHTKQNGWQKNFGYNYLYDAAFDLGTSMLYKTFDFSAGGVQFRLWLWKGDYLNLGAGAEAGIYYGGDPQWSAGTQYALQMTLSLYDNEGNQIFSWNPGEDNWWITGFNSNYQNIQASNLTVYGTINFSNNLDMWKAFYNMYNGNSMWTFDEEKHIASYTWLSDN
jgi:hypothetical protein